MENKPELKPNNTDGRSGRLTIKGLIICVLVLVLLTPTFMIQSLIREREGRQSEAFNEISGKWGRQQTLLGPILGVPYTLYTRDNKGAIVGQLDEVAYFLPETLKIGGNMQPEKRYRGIFEVVVYSGQLTLEGEFGTLRPEAFVPSGADMHWDKSVLLLGIPDLRGLREQVRLQWDEQEHLFEPGIPTPGIAESGMHVPLNLSPQAGTHRFSLQLDLKGSGSMFFTPVGKVTEVNLQSPWPDPSFTGAFLPDEKSIGAEGFQAKWKVLHLNRSYPQAWTSSRNVAFLDSAFGVDFLLPIDNYQKSERSVKYAILFIGLTFLVVFFIEMRQDNPVHPFQYALIGLALVIFYTLLVSMSEHLTFNAAYVVAALMTAGLTGLYAWSLFASGRMGLLVGFSLLGLYGFLFVTLQQQDYALLIGSFGLFAILAVIMYFSRRF
ncbi:MAG: cell envelope integrity protein CreD [Saprospiraceae bacterium]